MDVKIQLILKMELKEVLCAKKLDFGDLSYLVVY
ncbi:hypothetical protein ABH955_001684 [Bacillus sp. RC240]